MDNREEKGEQQGSGRKQRGVSDMGSKKSRWVFFKRWKREALRLKLLGSAFRWRRLSLRVSFLNDVLFRIVSVFEAIALVVALCFFYLCCGCHF